MLVDTHCHIHEASYPLDRDEVLVRAHKAGVEKVICVGTNEQSSQEAVQFVSTRSNAYASVGVHPHDAKEGWNAIERLLPMSPVAIGEIGLDYFYTQSPKEIQQEALQAQIELALKYNLPIIFHVRDAFDDFWPILDTFHGVRGELHSFTDSEKQLEEGLKRGLYVGVNGISTFTKSEPQKRMFQIIPLDRLLLETDAPFLTPQPLRGKINEPAFVRLTALYQAEVRGSTFEEVASITSLNATALFAL